MKAIGIFNIMNYLLVVRKHRNYNYCRGPT